MNNNQFQHPKRGHQAYVSEAEFDEFGPNT